MISTRALGWDWRGTDVEVRLFRPQRDGWVVGLAVGREWHPGEDAWTLTIGFVCIAVGLVRR